MGERKPDWLEVRFPAPPRSAVDRGRGAVAVVRCCSASGSIRATARAEGSSSATPLRADLVQERPQCPERFLRQLLRWDVTAALEHHQPGIGQIALQPLSDPERDHLVMA